MRHALTLSTLVVSDYDEAIDFFVGKLGFTLSQNIPAPQENAPDKRWVVVSPQGAEGPGLLLAQANGPEQTATIGNQTGGRVSFFLQTDDCLRDFAAFSKAGVEFIEAEPRREPYGIVAVFRDISGNLWDLIEYA